ncbi:unnamed protein product [Bursaphelenchus xylophilus]|uniref:(pine wood nematode) hypothetical protein n=1 Tax=Bursaphelenchus xylophilus TaxID=6326 RepID=A0A1I7SLU1_BURXY|nr:unnamed protein product [Bursaphelenchus xylophilus]CAG9129838.1 unnamed protein product [Bursaphelenchus xylophilus]
MCSFIGQILYGAVMLAALGLTLGSMFTSEWRKITDTGRGDSSGGLFNFDCQFSDLSQCRSVFDSRETWEKVVIIAMIVAVILEALAVAWTVFTFFACCCRKNMLYPYAGFALCSLIALVLALAFFFAHYKDQIGGVSTDLNSITGQANLGYSFYLGCGAAVANIIGLVIGGLTSCLTSEK